MHDGACPGLDSGMGLARTRPLHSRRTFMPHGHSHGNNATQGDSPDHRDTDSSGTVSDKGAVPLLHYRRKRHDDYEHQTEPRASSGLRRGGGGSR